MMSKTPRERFCLLDGPYLPCQWDFSRDLAAGAYFIAFFRHQFDRTLTLAQQQASAAGHDGPDLAAKLSDCRREFNAFLDGMLANPRQFTRPTILTIDYVRDRILRDAGFPDPYYQIKHHENEEVLELLPVVCRDLDAHAEPARLQAVIAGAMAGNIFDMGVAATASKMLKKSLCFLKTRDTLPPRPWLVDHFDALQQRMQGRNHRKAILFVDNAGADFILGMLPLARYLARRGTQVVVVGNELPSLNDMTLNDMREIWDEVLAAEPSFADLPITLASSGTGEPLIDLNEVSPQLNHLAADADLVVLEGMGRALESNYDTRFTCDALKLAMVKDEFVAQWLGGRLYDVICRFEPSASTPARHG